ncbi:hypothetical protein [Terriglobus saanensis]|uniref:Uncharacterized protein n=1 Tax=Terriglobus saanensis (strain ATCC BAA-1853 / DSM 23119 / SP1PR4) TaxID=401053 RepID=E8V8I0_TERSS|nr:hypothetical protein [Terriglobus saanensis]ADV82959.1 hypothetical protein AciPR4_2157 [Terriglobus saanensis SP1PR4]
MATDAVGHLELSQQLREKLESDNQAAQTGRRALRYSALVVLLPLLAIPTFIGLGRSDFFLHHGASVWVQSNDAIFQMRGRNCEVLVFGDSTAMTGIDPALVEKDTGYKTCNIAVTNAVLSVTDNMTLDHYLAQNARPKVLIVQLSPDSFQRENRQWERSIYAEGMLELMRHGNPAEVRHMFLSHPREAVAFAGYAAGFTAYYGLKKAFYGATQMRPEEDRVTVRNGFFTPPTPARTQCESTHAARATVVSDFPRNLAEEYRSNYARHSGTVLVDVAPIPACDEDLLRYEAELDGVTNNKLTPLPIGYFNDGRHYTASGSEVVSRLVSDEVNAATGQSFEEAQLRHGAHSYAAVQRSPLPR